MSALGPKVWRVELERDGVRICQCTVVARDEDCARLIGFEVICNRIYERGWWPGAARERNVGRVIVAPLFPVAAVYGAIANWPDAVVVDGGGK